jgi:hypothetical protein
MIRRLRTIVVVAAASMAMLSGSTASATPFTSIPIDLGTGAGNAPPNAHLVIAFKAGDITIPPPGTVLFDLILQPADSGSTLVATSATNPNFDDVVEILSGTFVDTRWSLNGGGNVIDFLQNVFPGVTTFAGLTIQSITLEISRVTVTAPSSDPDFPSPSVDATFLGNLVVDAVEPVPEPAAFTLLATGLASLAIFARRPHKSGSRSGRPNS